MYIEGVEEGSVSQESERFDLLRDLNDRILGIRDRLSEKNTSDLIDSLALAFFDLGSIFEELELPGFTEICEDLQQIFGTINAGKRPFNDFVKECLLLTMGLMYRKAINNEPCPQEVEDLALLIQGVKLGDKEGFQVTDHKIPLHEDEQIILFDDEDSVVLFDDEEETKEASAPDSSDSKSTVSAPEPEDVRPLNILVVDDELSSRILLRRIASGYGTCDFAINGVEALQAFQMAYEDGTPYNVIFMDVMMPEMDGHQALKEIRAFEAEVGVHQGKEVIVFMVTCLDSHDNVCKAFFKGYCTDYITKPIISSKILKKMREYHLVST